MRVDCVAEDVSPVGDRRWPSVKASTPSSGVPTTEASGCRFIFDYDRDPARKQGNLIKPDFPFSDVPTSSFTQHVINTIDFPFSDMDNPVLTSNHIDNERLNWAPREETGGGQAIVQNIFSMFSCNSGTQNQPPVFTTSLTSTDLRVNTVYECPFYRPCDANECPCEIDLYARDFRMTAAGEDARTSATLRTAEAANRVDIQYALGYDHLPMADLKSAAGIACTIGTACQGHAHFKYVFQPAEMMDSVTGFLRPDMIGKIVVRCFVAYDVFTQQTAQARSCPSMPLCIKIKVTGTKPQFVAPTPLGESFDDNGILVPDRHDYAACQGFPMQLKLTVKDSMPADVRRRISESAVSRGYLQNLKFRIFVEDKDVGFNRNTALKISYQYLNVGGQGNQDFFSTETVPVSSDLKEKCGTFSGYGAGRKGNNDAQDSPDPMAGQGRSKSVMSPYKSAIEYCSCTTPRSDPWCDCPAGSVREAQASLTVVFESDLAARRGVLLRDECRSIDLTGIDQVPIGTPDSTEYELANCREKLTNIDQVICAVGYDNARSVYKRWVGDTDPNGDDKKHWRRDHSNGDQASDIHCFRIFIAAPPVFVTDPTGTITPFSNKWSSFVDTTGVRAAYKEISVRVNQTRDLTFLAQVFAPCPRAAARCTAARRPACVHDALTSRLVFDCALCCVFFVQDPNPTDVIEIFIMAEPGIPKGMTIGSNDCILRKGENSMCKADDQIDRAIYPDEDWKATMAYNAASRCSRAKRTVSWTPPGDAAGHMFKVCAAARDNSNLCFGTVSDFATPRGWFGEQQCILIDVLRLLVKWGGDFVNLGSDPWTVKAYVGCEFKFHLTVSDALVDPNNAGDVPYALEAMLQDTGLPHVTTTAHSGTSGIGIPQRLAAATLDAVWVPRRRTEGKIFRMCFAARDLAGVLSTPTDLVCRGGSKHLLGCHSDGDCAGGVCQKACVEVEVQRCEYCIKDTDTLTWMTRYFGIESNWMRLWALNSFERGNALTRNVQGAIFPPAQPKIHGSSSNAYITDPDGILSTSHRVYVGVVYRASQSDTVLEVAARFRTTVKTLLAMNPDVEDDTSALSGEQRLCLVPCTADAD
jgi:hypothetical protein